MHWRLNLGAHKTAATLLPPEGSEGVERLGHREYVGGKWDEIGQLQFDFLVSNGLKPHHYLLDIACGSLRLGVKAIPYLERGHYLGIEKERSLIDLGIKQELGRELFEEKAPVLIADGAFDFTPFDDRPDFAIAQSLFTHLTPNLINLCFANLRPIVKPETRFFATYFLGECGGRNPSVSHDHGYFAYSVQEMLEFGTANGFAADYIGNWNHPRGQVMVEYHLP